VFAMAFCVEEVNPSSEISLTEFVSSFVSVFDSVLVSIGSTSSCVFDKKD
jgi:hypothetical protein